jgi:hypothetical protein
MLGFGGAAVEQARLYGPVTRQHALPAQARRQRGVHHRQVPDHRQLRRMAVIAGPPLLCQVRCVGRQQRQQLGVIQRIGCALRLPRQLARDCSTCTPMLAGWPTTSGPRPARARPLRQHLRPHNSAAITASCRQAPAQPVRAAALRPMHHHRAGHQGRRRRCRQLGQPVAASSTPARPRPSRGQRAPLVVGADRADQLSQAALLACLDHPQSPCLSWLGWSMASVSQIRANDVTNPL